MGQAGIQLRAPFDDVIRHFWADDYAALLINHHYMSSAWLPCRFHYVQFPPAWNAYSQSLLLKRRGEILSHLSPKSILGRWHFDIIYRQKRYHYADAPGTQKQESPHLQLLSETQLVVTAASIRAHMYGRHTRCMPEAELSSKMLHTTPMADSHFSRSSTSASSDSRMAMFRMPHSLSFISGRRLRLINDARNKMENAMPTPVISNSEDLWFLWF